MTQVDAARGGHTAPLSGWRDIAAYLGRNQSTVKRWAAVSGLPVHRPKGSAARKGVPVYAFTHELDAWLMGHSIQLAKSTPDAVAKAPSPSAWFSLSRHQLALLVGGFSAALLILVASPVIWRQPQSTANIRIASPLAGDVQQLYLDAVYLWQKRTPDTLQKAEQLLLRLAELAPDFGGAQADLAIVYNLMVEYGVRSPEIGYSLSRAAAEKAIALDPTLAPPHTVLGDIAVFWSRDYQQGLYYFERALALDPDEALTRHWYAAALMGLGRFDQAASEIGMAREREPMSRSIGVSRAMILLGLGQVEEAREALLQLIQNEPDYRSPYRFLSFVELARGDHRAYISALETRFTLTADMAGLAVVSAGKQALKAGGDIAMAQTMLAAARAQPENAPVEPYFFAHLLALAGEWKDAARQLGETPTRHAFYYGIDPAFAQWRSDPSFRHTIAQFELPIVP